MQRNRGMSDYYYVVTSSSIGLPAIGVATDHFDNMQFSFYVHGFVPNFVIKKIIFLNSIY